MCKWSDPFSKRVLIGRGLDHNSLETLKSQRKNVSSDYSVLKARPSKKYWTKYDKHVILVQSDRSVSMTVRFHLFPFRTQKLSSLVPKIVRWKRRVKIGSRRLEQKTLQNFFWSVFLLPESFVKSFSLGLCRDVGIKKYQSAGGVQISPPSSPSCFLAKITI